MDHEGLWRIVGHLLVGSGEPLRGRRQGIDVDRFDVQGYEETVEF